MSKLTQADRDALPASKFADPKNRKFPILDCNDFSDAWDLAGHAENPDAVRRRVLRMGRGLRCTLKPAMEAWRAQNGVDDEDVPAGAERALLAGVAAMSSVGTFDVLAISAGRAIGKPWNFTVEALRKSVDLWDGVEVFIDHTAFGGDGISGASRLRDLGGVTSEPRWAESVSGVAMRLDTVGPSGPLLAALGHEMLSDRDPLPKIGFSADVYFRAVGEDVTEILRVNSLDCVFDPARGGAFLRALNAVGGGPMKKKCPLCQAEYEDGTEHKCADADLAAVMLAADKAATAAAAAGKEPSVTELKAQLAALQQAAAQTEQNTKLAAELEGVRDVREQMCALLLDQALLAAKLPAPSAAVVRSRFQGKVFETPALMSEIELQRQVAAQLTAGKVVNGVTAGLSIYSSEDQLQAAVDDLLESPRDARSANLSVHRLTGIRELYHMLTGDYEYHGGFFPDRVRLATTADFTGLVKNAMNKIVVDQTAKLGRAGYDWWKPITAKEHFTSLQQITGTLVGTVGALPEVAESGEYTELVIGDSPETASFRKFGGYIPLTLELIDRDDARKLKQYPRELANGALRRISGLVAAIFTDNSGVGPTMADGGALFNSTAVTTAGGHANLLTTALAAAQWEVVGAAMYNQPQLIKNVAGYYGTGPKQGVDPKFLLVPRVLRLTGKQILYPALERAAQIYSENLQRGEDGDVITVPEWTDATDFAAVADPTLLPCIYVGDRFGIVPEIFIAGDENAPAVFANDEHRMKVRLFIAIWVNDFRGLHKSNVAG